ncbi:MAG: flavin reductase family protein [Muribaculaceae bacterium]|nr:flavin reductase family protein [Muribaculaceae bacterium]
MKQSWKPGTLLYPLPAVLVSCGDSKSSNLFTVAWTGIICTDPAMLYISVRPERYSYDLIKANMQFTVNLTTADMARATDYCGVRTGRDTDKWSDCGLHRHAGVAVECPAVEESPLSLECRVTAVLPLGTHHMFMARIVNVLADERYMDAETGKFRLEDAGLMNYSHGAYFTQGLRLGTFGFSVKKKTNSKS